MRKRRIYLILGVVGVLLAGVLVAVFRWEREPEYGGKRLSEWVESYAATPSAVEGSFEFQQADLAIRQFGTNALPYLLKWILYETPSWKTKLYEALNPALNRLNSEWRLSDPKEVRSAYAFSAFPLLGQQAKQAIPELNLMLNDVKNTNRAMAAAMVFGLLGSDGLPQLLVALTNQQQAPELRYLVAWQIGILGTNTEPSVRALKDLLTDSNGMVREGATNALAEIERRALAKKTRDERRRAKMK